MKKSIITFLLSIQSFTHVFADSHPGYPPNPVESDRKVSPAFVAANAQAIYWINLIDQQQFWASWLEASSLFRDVITRDQWAAAMRLTRTPLGPVTARQIGSYGVTQVLPYGTRGNFMLIQFNSQFAKKASMRESIVLMTEGPLAQWKVVSYSLTR